MPGDLLGFSGHFWSSAGINIATYGIPLWSLSHVAIVGEHEKKTVLFESLTDSPAAVPCGRQASHRHTGSRNSADD